MKKADVEISYHQGHSGCPMLNVKHHLWVPDLIRQFKDQGNHEFSDDAGFWAWLEERYDESDWESMDSADEWAREDCWELAQEAASEIWPATKPVRRYRKVNGKFVKNERGDFVQDTIYEPAVKVWSAGRQGGWLVVDGLPGVESWDAIELARWARFAKSVEQIRDEAYPYAFLWNLGANVYEHVRQERQNAYPAPNYAGSNA